MKQQMRTTNTVGISLGCILLALLFFTGMHCTSNKTKSHEGMVPVEVKAVAITGGWGFDIYVNHKPVIQQHRIPTVQGVHAFVSKEEALAVGNLMMHKIVKEERLPGVSLHELDSLHITIPQ